MVVTGLGVVSPLGVSLETFWNNLSSGTSGIGPIQFLSDTAVPKNMGGEAREFSESLLKEIIPKRQRKFIKVMCRDIQLGVTAALLAYQNSKLDPAMIDHDRFGVGFGANQMLSPPEVLKDACWACVDDLEGEARFQFEKWGEIGLHAMEPLWLLKYLPNMPACHIGICVDARGPSNSITMDAASGNLVLGEALSVIQRGAADIMIAGTTGTWIHPTKSIHAALWDELVHSDDPPETWCKPFDKNRNGSVVAEGSAALVLEEESHARNRSAEIFGELLGAGSSCVTDRNGVPQLRHAMANAMNAALRNASCKPDDIGHLNAHGSGAVAEDKAEAEAILEVFGDDGRKVPVTALKSYLGNSGSGAGPLEITGSLLGLRQGVIPPTLNYQTPDPECPLNVVHGDPLTTNNKTFLKVSVTRAGQASALVIRGE